MFDDDPIFDMANLTVEDTGVPGIIQILSDSKPRPRVRWYPSLPQSKTEPSLSVSISSSSTPRNLKLPPKVAQDAAPLVVAWVGLNKSDLLNYWYLGHSWSWREVKDFVVGLQKIS